MSENMHPMTREQSSPVLRTFIKYHIFLKRFLMRFFSQPQDIEDILQETYIKAHSFEKKQVVNSPKAFIFQIARNEALKELRKKSRRITDFIADSDTSDAFHLEASAEDEVIASQKLGIFCQSTLQMTPKCRRVFLMCKVYGMPYKSVAAELGITVSAVEKHVANGLRICNTYVERMEAPVLQSGTKKQSTV